MRIEKLLSDDTILAEIGRRLVQRRLELDLSQAMLADQAGVSKRTVGRIEAGESTQLSSMIRVLRVLDLIDRLESLLPEGGPRPMDLLKLRGKERQRVSREKKHSAEKPWRWGDEE